MPRISEFYGIIIYMYYRDHAPPHFHAVYSGSEAEVAIDTLETLDGYLPHRAMSLVKEWARLHQGELRTVWNQARSHQPLKQIDPLP